MFIFWSSSQVQEEHIVERIVLRLFLLMLLSITTFNITVEMTMNLDKRLPDDMLPVHPEWLLLICSVKFLYNLHIAKVISYLSSDNSY